MAVDLEVLKLCFDHTVGRVTYELGAKPALGADSSSFSKSDCSGWARWALDRSGLRIPDGSATEHDWFRQNGFRAIAPYSNVMFAAEDPSRLFIAFENPSPIGHVWLIRAGVTMECHGGTVNRGVDSRPAMNLASIVSGCYEIPCS